MQISCLVELVSRQRGKDREKGMVGVRTAFYLGLLFSITLIGCGYQFQGGGSILPDDVRRVYIPDVENRTTEAGVAAIVTEALRDQFGRFGVITVVDAASQADAELRCEILQVGQETRTTTSQTDVDLQLESRLVLSAELRRVGGGPLLWEGRNISVSRAFGTTSNAVVTSSADFAESKPAGSPRRVFLSKEIIDFYPDKWFNLGLSFHPLSGEDHVNHQTL